MYGKFQSGSAQPHFKRSHKKSRAGCQTCKQRRVKCDETRPACERCSARGLSCTYQEWVPKYQTPASGSESSAYSSSTPAESSNTGTEIEGDVVSETDLAHHYISHTSKTLAATSSHEAQNHSVSVVVPALAVTSTAVRSAMLSLAATCIYSHADADEDKPALLRVAYSHYNTCLRESGQQLQKLDQADHVDAIVATTRLLFALGLALCQIERRLGKSMASADYWIWLPLLRGNTAVMNSINSAGRTEEAVLHSQDIAPEIFPQMPHEVRDTEPVERLNPPPVLELLSGARVGSLYSLRKYLEEHEDGLSVGQAAQYRRAVDTLDQVMSYTCISPRVNSFLRLVFIWPIQIPQEFSETLMRGDRLALIVYAHWLMLTVLLEDLWIVGDMGRAGIFEIVARSGEWSEEEQELLLWPRRLLSVNR